MKRLRQNREFVTQGRVGKWQFTDLGRTYDQAAKALGSVKGEMSQGVQDAKNLADAQASAARSAADSTGPFGKFSDAMRRLSDTTADADSRARALHDALNILAGGSVNLSAAEARLNRSVSDASEALKDGVDHAQGYGKVLLNMDGSLSTVTRNGQKLYDLLGGLSTNSADAALAACQFAQANGKSVPEALQAAQKQMATARESAISTAQGFGLTAEQASNLADMAGLVPEKVSILLQTAGMDASMAELLAVQQALKATPDKKSVTLSTLSNEARAELERLGFKITDLKDRTVQVSAPTDLARADLDALIAKISATPGAKHIQTSAGTAATIASLEAVRTAIAGVPGGKSVTVSAPTDMARAELLSLGFSIAAIQGAINSIYGRTVTITTVHNDIWRTSTERGPGPWADGPVFHADGAIVTYASGGIRENHVAQIAKGGEWRVWAEDETQGEAYIPFASSKRARSKAILDQVARRFGGEVTYNASGGLSDWSYQPLGGSGFSISDVVSKSQKKKGDKEVFDLGLFESNLRKSVSTAESWLANLTTVAQRAGTDVAKALEDMGDDGVELTRKMATGSARYVQDMGEQLKKLSTTARASLADYTAQLQSAVKDNTAFQSALTQLPTSGFGALAERLAKQNAASAEALAKEAVRDRGKAEKANAAAEAAGQALDGEQLTDLVKLISALGTGRSIHDVADLTGIGEDRLIEVVNLAAAQLRSTGGRERFLADLAKANRGQAYANGGIWEPGVYGGAGAARPLIKFAEPETRGESYIPHAVGKRSRATAVLSETAGRFGYGLVPRKLVDSGSGRAPVVVVQQSPAIGTQTINVANSPASANDIASAVAYQLRRAKRGGLR